MNVRILAIFFASSLALAGCNDARGGAASASSARRDTVDGVARVRYAADRSPTLGWTVDTVAVLGDALGDTTQQFDRVTPGGLAGDAAGDLYVLDGSSRRVLKYGPDGGYLGAYGRAGGGPGELGSPVALGVGAGDSLWVVDLGNTRISILPQGAGDARGIPLDLTRGLPGLDFAVVPGGYVETVRPMRIMGRGGAGGRGRGPDADAKPEPGDSARSGEAEAPSIPVKRMDAVGDVVATLWHAPEPETDEVRSSNGNSSFVLRVPRAFEPRLQWAALPDGGIVVVDGADYRLHFVDPDGHEVLRVEHDPAPRPTTDADREAAREKTRSAARSGGGMRVTVSVMSGSAPKVGASAGGSGPVLPDAKAMAEQQAKSMTFADVIPRVTGLRVDRHGRVWVGVSEQHPGEADRIDVYDRDGRLLGELHGVPLPDAFTGADRAAVLTRDDMDVQHIVLLKLVPGRR